MDEPLRSSAWSQPSKPVQSNAIPYADRDLVVVLLGPQSGRRSLARNLGRDALADVAFAVAVDEQRDARLALGIDEPGVTARPVASISCRPRPDTRPISTMRSPLTATSARRDGAPVPSMTSPFRMTRSYLGPQAPARPAARRTANALEIFTATSLPQRKPPPRPSCARVMSSRRIQRFTMGRAVQSAC